MTAHAHLGNPILNNINDVSFQFEFPKFGQLPGPSVTNGLAKSSSAERSPGGHASPVEQAKDKASPASSTYTNGLDAQTKGRSSQVLRHL